MDESTGQTTSPRQAPLNTKMVLGGAVCAVGAVALLMIGRPSQSPEEMVAELHGVSVDQVERVEPFAVETVEETAKVSIPVSSTPRAASTIAVSAPAPKETAPEAKRAVAPPSPVLSETSAASASSAAAAQTPADEAVTVAGCLARDDDSFMLKDATGDAAPTGRSWKSGFLKKRSSSIALIDEGSLRLASHVGQRVEMRGVLADRQMRAKSLRVIGECD